jgi:hypothetical protein
VKKGKMKQGIMKQWNNRKKINGTHEHWSKRTIKHERLKKQNIKTKE